MKNKMDELLLILMAEELRQKALNVYYDNQPCTWKEAVDFVLNDLHLKLLSV